MKIPGLFLALSLAYSCTAQASMDACREAQTEARASRIRQNFELAESRAKDALNEAGGATELRVMAFRCKYESLLLLGGIYEDQGKYVQAEDWYLEALTLAESDTGKDSEIVITTLNHLARMYIAGQDLVHAIAMYEREEHIQSRKHGKNSADVAVALVKIARTQQDLQQFENAERSYLRVVAILEKSGGINNPDLRPPLEALAQICAATGRKDEGADFIKRASGLPD